MANKATAATSWRWRLLLLLLLAVAALCWIPPAIAMAAAASTAKGARRSLLGFVEAQGNSSYRCNPSGPCITCQYSEKNDEKYCCSETGYRLPLKCVEVQNGTKEGNTTKQRKVLGDASTSGGAKHYVTYRSCVPLEDEEKLSVLGFEHKLWSEIVKDLAKIVEEARIRCKLIFLKMWLLSHINELIQRKKISVCDGPHGWNVANKWAVRIFPEKADNSNARGFKNPDEPS